MPAPTLIPSRILCDWKIRHQTHVLCGRTTFVPNQIRYQTYTVPTCGAQHTQGGAGCSTHCAVQHSTHGAVLRSMVQCRTAHTVQCTGQDTQWGAEHNTNSVVQSTAHRVWSSTQSSAAQHPGCSAVHSTHSAVEGTTRAVQHSAVQCSTAHTVRCSAQHTQCAAPHTVCSAGHCTHNALQHAQCSTAQHSAVHNTHNALRSTALSMQGTVQHAQCRATFPPSAAQCRAGQCTAHTVRFAAQYTQCSAGRSTHSAWQHSAVQCAAAHTVQCSAVHATHSAVRSSTHTVHCSTEQSSAVHMLSDTRTVNSTPVTNFFAAAPKLYVKQRGVDSPEFDVLGW